MNRQIAELRTWVLIAVSFAVGLFCSEFVEYQWQTGVDVTTSVVSSRSVPAETQP